MLEQHTYDFDAHRYMQWGSAFVVLRTYIRTMLEQHAYDPALLTIRRYVQRGRAAMAPRICICTMLEQQACDFDVRRYMQWVSAFVVLRTYIRAMLEQHRYDLGPPTIRRHV
jgi:hypothetical protein